MKLSEAVSWQYCNVNDKWSYYINTKMPRDQFLQYMESIKSSNGSKMFSVDVSSDVKWGYKLKQEVKKITWNDLILINGQQYLARACVLDNDTFFMYRPGTHDYDDAVFIAARGRIKKLGKIEDVSLYSIAPTILYLMGLPTAKDMQGKVLTQIIDDSCLINNRIREIKTYEFKPAKKIPNKNDGKYDEEYKKELKALGYVQ